MKTPIRTLFIEDSEDDTQLLVRELLRGDFESEFKRVETGEALKDVLRESWDIIFCDFGMPNFDSFSALSIMREAALDIPFIIVSGTIGEDRAVQAMKAGANDYILKNNLTRLVPAVRRELTEAKKRRDLKTELQKKEAEIRQLQKLEAMGKLAGGVSHDFNNILAIIQICCDMALERLDKDVPARELLKQIKEAQDKGAALTKQLLAFSRNQLIETKTFSINALLNDISGLLRKAIPESVTLVLNLSPDLGSVTADPGQIERIMLNLIFNARDAIPDIGSVTVQTENVELGSNFSQRLDLPVHLGSYILLSIKDTGTGMTKETLSRIFEPFFTTKEVGRGTGLGLATVYGIIKQAQGTIEVDSQIGRGTVFRIYLPRTNGSLKVSAEVPSRQLAKAVASIPALTRILLVEDEEPLRRLMSQILQREGYNVLEACDGEAGLSLCIKDSGPLHLIITDVVMPKMGGREFIERTLAVRKNFKVLYLSGYSEDVLLHHGISQLEARFLAKPFSARELLANVRELVSCDT